MTPTPGPNHKFGPTEKAVLDCMAKAPDLSFSLKKLGEITGCRINAVSRIMPNLKEYGLVFRHSQEGESYWRLSDSARNALQEGTWDIKLMAKDAGKADGPDEDEKAPCPICEDRIAEADARSQGAGAVTLSPLLLPKPAEPDEPKVLERYDLVSPHRCAANLLREIKKLVSIYGGRFVEGITVNETTEEAKPSGTRIMLDIKLEGPIV